ncbi:MAG: Xaa-Pro peptidase family protein [Spirochaetes bacterium]|nr:Xaa-Pro peptidase family protein [Spirochaetota bacterium]
MSHNDLNLPPVKYLPRLEQVWDWMDSEGISLVMLEDASGRRDQSVRWLTGQPGDALLFLSFNRRALLVPWDINLARQFVNEPAIEIAPYTEYGRLPKKAVAAAAKRLGIANGSKIEIPSITPYPSFLDFVGELADFDIICREKGASAEFKRFRTYKDDEEIAIYRKAAEITNGLIDLIEADVKSGKIKTEADAALLIETESRRHGCEGPGFGTLAAGVHRSFAIHAFPQYTFAPFAGPGLSILDFGVRLAGYTTDVTLTFARSLNPQQERLVALVERAYEKCLALAQPGVPASDVGIAIEKLFAKEKKKMPHGLGHGVGLDEHEYPVFRAEKDNEWTLEPGMVFTLEPGLYDPAEGGCRLENDILLTPAGQEVLTKSRIIRL